LRESDGIWSGKKQTSAHLCLEFGPDSVSDLSANYQGSCRLPLLRAPKRLIASQSWLTSVGGSATSSATTYSPLLRRLYALSRRKCKLNVSLQPPPPSTLRDHLQPPHPIFREHHALYLLLVVMSTNDQRDTTSPAVTGGPLPGTTGTHSSQLPKVVLKNADEATQQGKIAHFSISHPT
jgi:hypothetical protein